MIGIIIVTHGNLGKEMMDIAGSILKSSMEAVIAISITEKEDLETLRDNLSRAVKTVNRKKGVLIFTDMFGGSPSNMSYSFLEEGRVDVISGVNLPMLIKALESRHKMSLSELAECLEAAGKKSISMGSLILKGKK